MWPLSSAHGSLSASTFFNTLARYLRSFLKPFVTTVAFCKSVYLRCQGECKLQRQATPSF